MFWKKKDTSTLERDIEVYNKFVEDLFVEDITQEEVELSRGDAKKETKRLLSELYPDYFGDFDKDDWSNTLEGFTKEFYRDAGYESGAECFLHEIGQQMLMMQNENDYDEFKKRAFDIYLKKEKQKRISLSRESQKKLNN